MYNPDFIFSFDAEANGLHGEVFCIGSVLMKVATGEVVWTDVLRTPIRLPVDPYVTEHVLPSLASIPVTHMSAKDMRDLFWDRMKACPPITITVADFGWPVATGLLSACVADNPVRRMSGPFPLHEVSSLMLGVGMDPYQDYTASLMPPTHLTKHHPGYDAHLSALLAQRALVGRKT